MDVTVQDANGNALPTNSVTITGKSGAVAANETAPFSVYCYDGAYTATGTAKDGNGYDVTLEEQTFTVDGDAQTVTLTAKPTKVLALCTKEVIKTTYSGSSTSTSTITRSFDDSGKLLVEQSSSSTIRCSYNANGLISKKTETYPTVDEQITTYEYDARGNMIKEEILYGGVLDASISYRFNDHNDIIEEISDYYRSNGAGLITEHFHYKYEYQYDTDGKVLQQKMTPQPDSTGRYSNEAWSITNVYDENGRLDHTDGEGIDYGRTFHRAFEYDKNGFLIRETHTDYGTYSGSPEKTVTTYTNDQYGNPTRVVEKAASKTTTTTYTYTYLQLP